MSADGKGRWVWVVGGDPWNALARLARRTSDLQTPNRVCHSVFGKI